MENKHNFLTKRQKARELLKLGRMEFAGFLFSVMLSGALALQGVRLGYCDAAMLLAVAILINFWGFAHNDICDNLIDCGSAELSGRPLVSGAVSVKSARILIIVCIAAAFAIAAANPNRVYALFVLLASILPALLYNMLSKKLPGSDVFFAFSTALTCLLGAVLAADSPIGGDPAWNMVWTVAVILFIDHVIFNAGATLKDVKNDGAMSAVTMATFSGVRVEQNDSLLVTRRFRGLIMLLKLLSLLVLLASPLWTGIGFAPVQFILLAVAAVISLYLTIHALNIEFFDRKKIGRRWMLQEAGGKLLVPLLLLETAGWQWSLFLIAAPFAWFLLFNAVLYRRTISLHDGF